MTTLTQEQIEKLCIDAGDPLEGGEETIRYLSDKFVVARKSYMCAVCTGQVQPGERHRVFKAVVDEIFGSFRVCADCCVAQAEAFTYPSTEEAEDRFISRFNLYSER